ncbi:Dna-mediated transposase [Oopsacas minuta]|uniref:Dna-mediated transposase n=1 Tax=Oopsacas minuta TaxID=111878 RepID=A0AAV7KHG9_9METZ|nr:Dna-mediated transposase [Oopsacas minuta]
MDKIVNPQTERILVNRLFLTGGHVQVDIVRSLFDTKMAGLLDGAGGASCHLCTASDEEIKSIDWVRSGFTINRLISDAGQLFDDVNEDHFLKLPSKQRLGITHKPTSDINIIAASPLHAYLCVFWWYMLLIYHLDAGHKVWSPSDDKVNASMRRIRAILLVKCSFSVDIPSSQGGTSTTGNIARNCFLDKRDFLKWATSSINLSDKLLLEKIQTYLSVVLRLVNSGNLINCSKMEELCKETYEYILVQFPWANVTPSLHKLLSHSFKIIGEYNNGRGLQNLSEECLEACNKFVRRIGKILPEKQHSLTMYEIF